MFSGHGFECARVGVGPGQELIQPAIGVAVRNTGEHVGQIALRINAVKFARFDQRGDDRPVLAAAVGAGEERILSIQRDRPDRPLDDVAVDLDAAVVDEPD